MSFKTLIDDINSISVTELDGISTNPDSAMNVQAKADGTFALAAASGGGGLPTFNETVVYKELTSGVGFFDPQDAIIHPNPGTNLRFRVLLSSKENLPVLFATGSGYDSAIVAGRIWGREAAVGNSYLGTWSSASAGFNLFTPHRGSTLPYTWSSGTFNAGNLGPGTEINLDVILTDTLPLSVFNNGASFATTGGAIYYQVT